MRICPICLECESGFCLQHHNLCRFPGSWKNRRKNIELETLEFGKFWSRKRFHNKKPDPELCHCQESKIPQRAHDLILTCTPDTSPRGARKWLSHWSSCLASLQLDCWGLHMHWAGSKQICSLPCPDLYRISSYYTDPGEHHSSEWHPKWAMCRDHKERSTNICTFSSEQSPENATPKCVALRHCNVRDREKGLIEKRKKYVQIRTTPG